MIMTQDKLQYFLRYGKNKKFININISEKCNLSCAHCNMNSSPESSGKQMPNKIIDYIFNQIDSSWGVVIFGGEPVLFPKKVEYIAKKCHEKNINFELPTNGFWGKNKKIINILKKIKPTVICFSLDCFHNIDYKTLINIVEEFKNEEDIFVTYEEILEYENKNKEKFEKYDIAHITEILTNTGRSKEYNIHFEIKGPKMIYCQCRGLDIRSDGKVYALCANHQGCLLSNNIFEENLEELRKNLIKITPKFKLKGDQIIPNIYSVCQSSRNDSKWLDQNYVEYL